MKVDTFYISLMRLKQPFESNCGRVQDANLSLNSTEAYQVKRLRVVKALNGGSTTGIGFFSFFAKPCCPTGRPFLIEFEVVGSFAFTAFEVHSLGLSF